MRTRLSDPLLETLLVIFTKVLSYLEMNLHYRDRIFFIPLGRTVKPVKLP